jgi:hypothetical protein
MDVTLLDWLMFVIAIGAFVGASAELLRRTRAVGIITY